jgi:Ca2+-binding RTX toxin-like protein
MWSAFGEAALATTSRPTRAARVTILGWHGEHEIVGSSGDDLLYGDAATLGSPTAANIHYDDNVSGGAGDDNIYGGHGNDELIGNDGADVLDGTDGFESRDILVGADLEPGSDDGDVDTCLYDFRDEAACP